jgi:branched-chain amino acid transport system substrate-binding protein
MKKLATIILAIVLLGAIPHAVSAQSKAGEQVVIGFIGPLTGPSAYIGVDSLHGCIVAAEDINQTNPLVVKGKKYAIRVEYHDDEMNPAKSVAGMKKLKEKFGISTLVNNLSGTIMALLQENEKLGVITIGYFRTPHATTRGNKLVLRYQATAYQEVAIMGKQAAEVYKAKTYAIISENTEFGKTLVPTFEKSKKDLGYNITSVALEWFDPTTTTDFRPLLTKIKATNPDIIVCFAYDEATAGIIIQAKELGIKQKFLLFTAFQALGQKMTGPARIEGFGMPLAYFNVIPTPLSKKYYQEIYPKQAQARGWKEPMGDYGLNNFGAVWTLRLLMEKAGSVDDAYKIKAEAPHIFPIPEKYNSVGLTAWDDKGEGTTMIKMGIFHNGKLYTPEYLESQGIKVGK